MTGDLDRIREALPKRCRDKTPCDSPMVKALPWAKPCRNCEAIAALARVEARLAECSNCHFPLDPDTRRCMPCESRDEILERMKTRLAAAGKLAEAFAQLWDFGEDLRGVAFADDVPEEWEEEWDDFAHRLDVWRGLRDELRRKAGGA